VENPESEYVNEKQEDMYEMTYAEKLNCNEEVQEQ